MKRILLVLCIYLAMPQVHGQTDTSFFTLEKAIEKALQARYEMKIQQTGVLLYENEEKKVNTRNLPTITGDLDLRWNTQLQTNILPAGAIGPTERRIQFGTPYNTILAFNFVQPVLNLQNIEDKRIAKTQTEYYRMNQSLTAIQIRQDVTEAYLNTLLWKERTRLSEINVQRTGDLFRMAESQLREGAITTYDLQRTRLDAENAKAEHQKNKHSLEQATDQLNYKTGGELKISASQLEDLAVLYKKMAADYTAQPEIKRTELLMEKAQKEIYDLNARKQSLGVIPTVNLYANYTFWQLAYHFNPFNTSRYFPYNYLGIKASMPIYNGGLRGRAKAEYKLRSEGSRLNYEKLKNDYTQEMRDAITSLKNADEDLNYQKKNLEVADELYKMDSARFNNGTIRQTELSTTYYTLQQTQNNYITAVYNYLISVVNYKKAVGTL